MTDETSTRPPLPGAAVPCWTPWERWGVAGLMLVLAALTVPTLGRNGFWIDEIYTANLTRTWGSMFEFLTRQENNMALYLILLRGWESLGSDEFTIRLLSVVFALLTLPVFHALARRLFDGRTALIGGALLVSNPFFLYYASEARSYSLLVLLTTTASLWFVRGLDEPRYRIWVAYGATLAAGVYAHYFALLIVPVHALALLGRKVPWRQIGVGLGVFGLLWLPLVWFRPAASAHELDWLGRPNLASLSSVFRAFFFSGRLANGIVAGLCAWLVARWALRRATMSARQGWSLRLAVSWLVVPVVIAFGFSLVCKPAFFSRYLIGCVPAVALIVAVAIAQMRTWAAVGTVLVLFAALITRDLRHGFGHGGPWREAAQYVRSHADAGDAILCYPSDTADALRYYLQRMAAPRSLMPPVLARGPTDPEGGSVGTDPALGAAAQFGTEGKRVWLVVLANSLADQMNPGVLAKLEATLAARLRRQEVVHCLHRGAYTFNDIDIICFSRDLAASPPSNAGAGKP